MLSCCCHLATRTRSELLLRATEPSSMMMECFNDILLKLREVHEREVEGWQVKVQELSNKKGCDTKRMEELFTRNQQMKEQQRTLTENIKTLENRLRAGLCDRCTVTQEVAKRRQQEFESSQIQSLQHISLLATEMSNVKKENKRLREDIRNLKAALEDQNDQSKSNSVVEVKPQSSPERSPSSGPGAVLTAATGRSKEQSADGEVLVKSEAEHRAEEAEGRTPRGTGLNHLDYKQLLLPTLSASSPGKMDHSVGRVRERRAPEGHGQHSSIPPQPLLKNLSSSLSAEVKPSRHVPYAPVPRHPQPIKASPLPIPWPLAESTDWVTLTAVSSSPMIQTSPRIHLPHFPPLAPGDHQLSPRRPAFGSGWQKQSSGMTKEPTVVFRLSALPDYTDVHTQSKPPEGKQSEWSKAGRTPGEGLRDAFDGPLDLSDQGKSKLSPTQRGNSPLALQSGSKAQKSPEIYSSPEIPVTPPSPDHSFSSPSCTPAAKLEQGSPRNHQEEDTDEGMDQSNNKKKVPVLTISLRPVVLESLNSALQKQESLSSNGKSSSPAKEPESSADAYVNKDSHTGQEVKQNCKRKRETESDRDSDAGSIHQ
ncbi:RBBP8 N-terminal-like protein isoform X2 [Gouania willdenowi]|uniref:RBBP8 N-terminal-like protein isoform X2 n=1 Tax=Gouania willdenowi TaxID=441366 RepID=UPI001054FCF7|nr:RBBP8 N-terminal-like protein isoform X2 [Gouania willdenowi]